MTSKQRALYWRAWAAAKRAIERKLGKKLTAEEATIWRHRCHEQAGAVYRSCGGEYNRIRSSKELTNYELDNVLAAFYAWSAAGSKLMQERQHDQPVIRCHYVVDVICDRIHAKLIVKGRAADAAAVAEVNREAYLRAILISLAPAHFDNLNDYPVEVWHKLIAVLQFRLKQVSK